MQKNEFRFFLYFLQLVKRKIQLVEKNKKKILQRKKYGIEKFFTEIHALRVHSLGNREV